MRSTGGTVRVGISVVTLMLASACAAGPSEEAADAKSSPATTGTTVDFFATTLPELAAIIPNEIEKPSPTTTVPAPTTTAPTPRGDDAHRSRADHVGQADVIELFLNGDDLLGWDVGLPELVGSAQSVGICSPITDAEIAANEFETWLTHWTSISRTSVSSTSVSSTEMSQFQMLGHIPKGAEAVGVIEQMGTMACLNAVSAGATGIESGPLDDRPPGVSAAAYWMISYEGVFYVGLYAVLDNGIAMAFGAVGTTPLSVEDIEDRFVLAVAKATAG